MSNMGRFLEDYLSKKIGMMVTYIFFCIFIQLKILEACDFLKLLSIYFELCVDATGVVINLAFSALIFKY